METPAAIDQCETAGGRVSTGGKNREDRRDRINLQYATGGSGRVYKAVRQLKKCGHDRSQSVKPEENGYKCLSIYKYLY